MPHRAEVRAHAPVAGQAPRRSQVFVFEGGFLFACDGMVAPQTERHTATLLIATTDDDIGIEVAGRREQVAVAMLRPFCPKSLHAPLQPFVSIGIDADHPKYRAFTGIAAPGCAALPRDVFPALRPALDRLRSGELSLHQAQQLFADSVEAAAALLPPLGPLDPRIGHVTALLKRNHRQPLEALAGSACLSYYRLSHLFSHEMGMSLRQYVLSLKIQAASRCIGAGMSLTATAHEAGFTDSAHLSRVWTKAFGGPPSLFLNARQFSIQSPRMAH
jgi:AraC-like DNA-binding protein